MTVDDAAKILSKMYLQAEPKEKVVQIHLFGIKFAEQIKHMSPAEIAVRADLPKTYGTEINKARNLARYVILKPSLGDACSDHI
jgi:hypothetical protein